jgi:hypothetical protein
VLTAAGATCQLASGSERAGAATARVGAMSRWTRRCGGRAGCGKELAEDVEALAVLSSHFVDWLGRQETSAWRRVLSDVRGGAAGVPPRENWRSAIGMCHWTQPPLPDLFYPRNCYRIVAGMVAKEGEAGAGQTVSKDTRYTA